MNTFPHQFQMLHFKLNEVHMGIPLAHVNKVLPLSLLETIPDGPAYLAGLLKFADKKLPIINLSLRLGIDSLEAPSSKTRVILCHNGYDEAGIIVDEMIGITDVSEPTLQMRDEFYKNNIYFQAAVLVKTELVLLVNVQEILSIPAVIEPRELHFENTENA